MLNCVIHILVNNINPQQCVFMLVKNRKHTTVKIILL